MVRKTKLIRVETIVAPGNARYTLALDLLTFLALSSGFLTFDNHGLFFTY